MGKANVASGAPTVTIVFISLCDAQYNLESDLGRWGHESHCAPLPDLRAGFHRRSWSPATGLETYTYDANGIVLTFTDAKAVTTTYSGYDGLNRPQSKSYSDGTPTVTYQYDQGGWKGAVSQVTTAGNSGTTYTYDGLGRLHTSTQTTAGTGYPAFIYTYNLADELTKIQYPSGRAVTYGLDSSGRVSTISGASGSNYASVTSYTAAGGIASMTLLNGVTEARTWNDRLQPSGLTASKSGQNLFALGLYDCVYPNTTCSTGNTGNLVTQTISLPGLNLTQNYSYDALNRLQSATETPGSWYQAYQYTASGNRYIDAANSDNFSVTSYTPKATTDFNTKNQLTSNVNSATFDSSGNGNQTGTGSYSYTYDAEGRITTSTLSGIITAYVYDGQGQRVQKITCPANTITCTATVNGAAVTTYLYDASGNLAAEYGATASGLASDCGTFYCYVSVDQLGSTRLVTDSNGNVVKRYDFLPFGEEAWAGSNWGGRSTAMGYQNGADGFNPKFTGQERDTESLLDYYHARYYAPYQGRFVSPDPANAGADVSNPQTWNGYSYVGNNPLNVTDPTGESWFSTLAGVFAGLVTWNVGFGLEVATIFNSFEDVMSGKPPSFDLFGPPGNLSGLGGCGGPLGTCGTLGAGPWSELPGLDTVQDPGRFIFDATPVSGQVPYQDATVTQSQGVLTSAEKYLGTDYMQIHQCTGLLCIAIRTINSLFPTNSPVNSLLRNPGLRQLSATEKPRAGDVMAWPGSHVGFYDPNPPHPDMYLFSALGRPERPPTQNKGVVWINPAYFSKQPPQYFRVRVPCNLRGPCKP